jgi:SPP1 gp7 family putative phage head morphogenesis protein
MATVEQLRIRSRVLAAGSKRRGTRPASIPLARPPSAVAMEYGTFLLEVFADVNAAIRRGLEHAYILTRQDSPADGDPLLASQVAAAVARMHKEVNLVLSVRNFGVRLQQIGSRTANWSDAEFRRQLRSAFGVDLLGTPDVGPIIRRFREENVRLIRESSQEKIRRVQAVIRGAPLEGRHENLVDKIQEATGFGDARCRLIARDQVLRLYGTVTEARHRNAGITHYTWVTSRDERVRPDHAALDGKVFAYQAPPIVDEATGRRANPGQDFQCRCIGNPVISI